MAFHSVTFRIGDRRFLAEGRTAGSVRDAMRRAIQIYGQGQQVQDVKWSGDTGNRFRGQKSDLTWFDEAASLPQLQQESPQP